MTTSIRAYGISKRKCASMISSPLFIIVAESTVIFGPIDQLGWRGASSTVTSREGLEGTLAEGAAARGEDKPADGRRVLAAEALPERAVLAVDGDDPRPGRRRPGADELARHHQDLLGGGGDVGAGVEGGEGGTQRGGAADADADDVGVERGDLAGGLEPDPAALGEGRSRRRVDDRAPGDVEAAHHLGERGGVPARDHPDELEAIRMARDDLAGLPADRAGGAEEDDATPEGERGLRLLQDGAPVAGRRRRGQERAKARR